MLEPVARRNPRATGVPKKGQPSREAEAAALVWEGSALSTCWGQRQPRGQAQLRKEVGQGPGCGLRLSWAPRSGRGSSFQQELAFPPSALAVPPSSPRDKLLDFLGEDTEHPKPQARSCSWGPTAQLGARQFKKQKKQLRVDTRSTLGRLNGHPFPGGWGGGRGAGSWETPSSPFGLLCHPALLPAAGVHKGPKFPQLNLGDGLDASRSPQIPPSGPFHTHFPLLNLPFPFSLIF